MWIVEKDTFLAPLLSVHCWAYVIGLHYGMDTPVYMRIQTYCLTIVMTTYIIGLPINLHRCPSIGKWGRAKLYGSLV